jgi:hypothetical protein
VSIKAQAIVQEDPAGLDKLLLAAGKGVCRYLEGVAAAKIGRHIELWDGPDGLGAVLDEHLKEAGVPNKRLSDFITPRALTAFVVPKRKIVKRRRKVGR